MSCPLPNNQMLSAFDEVTLPGMTLVAHLTRESRTLTAIRDALLPRLVSGRIRIPLFADPEEAPGTAIDASSIAPA